jgi:hypothetical protein
MHLRRTVLPLLLLLACSAAVSPAAERAAKARAAAPASAEERLVAAVRAADDERVAATVAGDRRRLEAIYSDDLHYRHSNGRADTKASQIEGLVAGANRYESFEYKERTFTPAAPGIVLMQGRLLMHTVNKKTAQKNTLDLFYLAVWREENGRWRFLAWQSCRNPEAEAKK